MMKNIVIAFVLIFFQVTVLNFLNLSAYVIPFIYPMLVLSLNRSINRSLLLVICFGLGLLIDGFSNTGGAHTMGLLLIGFLRPYLLSSIGPSDSGSENINPSIYNLGLQSYAVYLIILLLAHHSIVFFMEVFTMSNFFSTLMRVLASASISFLLILLLQLIIVKRED